MKKAALANCLFFGGEGRITYSDPNMEWLKRKDLINEV